MFKRLKKKLKPVDWKVTSLRYVQRGIKLEKENVDKKGIDKIIRFEYMGSAEYEWGALPSSLEKMREYLHDYSIVNILFRGKQIQVFSFIKTEDSIKHYLEKAFQASNDYEQKEPSYFSRYILEDFSRGTDFWWDITNHIMFWDFDATFASKFENLIVKK